MDSIAADVKLLRTGTFSEREEPGRLGLWLFILSEVLLFGAFFSSYFIIRWGSETCRLGASAWPDATAKTALGLAAVNTFVLITSSYTMVKSLFALERGDADGFGRFLKITIALGLVFLAVKGIEYAGKFHHGFYPGGAFVAENPGYGIFFSFYFVMTGLHAAHVIAGLIWNALLLRSRQSRSDSSYRRKAEYAGLYWHFVDVVWVFLFPLFYII